MRNQSMRYCAVILAVSACAATAQAQSISFSTIGVPTNVIDPNLETRSGTTIRGINDGGEYVGSFGERNATIWGVPHSFIHTNAGNLPAGVGADQTRWGPDSLRLGEITGTRYALNPSSTERFHYLDLKPEAYPSDFNAAVSLPNAINNAGMVVGGLSSNWLGAGPSTAFTFNSRTGAVQMLSVPGAQSSVATDINAAGQIVGNFSDASGDHGFLYSSGIYTVIDMPGEVGRTRLGGINDAGTIVGSAYDVGNPKSFVYRSGSFSYFQANNLYTVAADINNAEQIVGWVGVSGTRRGFLYQGGSSTLLDLAADGFNSTYAYTINNLGLIGGVVEGRADSAFLATVTSVPEPAVWALWAAGLAGLAAARRKRAV